MQEQLGRSCRDSTRHQVKQYRLEGLRNASSINPPGISTTIAHLLQALDAVEPGASALVRRVENKEVSAIVGPWPAAFEAIRAHTLGFASHEPLVEVVRAFVEDDLEATRVDRGIRPLAE